MKYVPFFWFITRALSANACERLVALRSAMKLRQSRPIHTYGGRGATKPGLVMSDHGVIHTSVYTPNLMPGENITKYSIQVRPTASEELALSSRVNYGKAYVVSHEVRVLDIGMVVKNHRYLVGTYFDNAMADAVR